ncbi:Hpt domain-containing protein [Enterovibrio sp. ZSDZ35]|uniref:Hpt domain-containing protein n=1 Tax=Enterovibrio qingdaonensis TaxID=2899818 RepID=A0ABT5QL18_9GAMM|nr:Hpt domain-containing protein [Enterovibrio sp. ZSDZ35]MDD1781319.1 Hpt domain-containing protein [Enterovibrio sp. ZSDZ35]
MTSLSARSGLRNPLGINNKSALHRVSYALWGVFVFALGYALYAYQDLIHVKGHTAQVVTLNNAAQQLRQTVSASMLNQERELTQIEKEVQHFRYLLLRSKSHTIDDSWEDIQSTLVDADSFVEDVDNLLASIYSVSKVTRQLKSLTETHRSPELIRLFESISSYLLFEFHGLNGDRATSVKRFNHYIEAIERELSSSSSNVVSVELYTLYTGLIRLNRQLESLDSVINHKFVRAITQQQQYWTNRVILLLDNILFSAVVAFLALGAQVLIRYTLEQRAHQHQTSQINPSRKHIKDTKQEPKSADSISELELFDAHVLIEQLEGDVDAIDSVLTMFVAEHQNDAQKVRKQNEQNEVARNSALIHNLKGVAGNIGALALEDFCKDVELSLKEGHGISDASLEQFEKLLTMTIQSVLKEMEQLRRTLAT